MSHVCEILNTVYDCGNRNIEQYDKSITQLRKRSQVFCHFVPSRGICAFSVDRKIARHLNLVMLREVGMQNKQESNCQSQSK